MRTSEATSGHLETEGSSSVGLMQQWWSGYLRQCWTSCSRVSSPICRSSDNPCQKPHKTRGIDAFFDRFVACLGI